MRWYKNDVATMIVNHKTVANLKLNLDGRLFFNAEANARLNGDVVHSTVQNTRITVGDRKSNTGLNGKWNTGFSFHGLKATQTNSPRGAGCELQDRRPCDRAAPRWQLGHRPGLRHRDDRPEVVTDARR
ncbi:hypothetical protein Q9Q99_18645 [Curtobacterium flaccumfaciens]|nr:hypothetical protein Q9Q99_18645 [Curtobacterium flaccumfaciens]